jgi:hypothetical protein
MEIVRRRGVTTMPFWRLRNAKKGHSGFVLQNAKYDYLQFSTHVGPNPEVICVSRVEE